MLRVDSKADFKHRVRADKEPVIVATKGSNTESNRGQLLQ